MRFIIIRLCAKNPCRYFRLRVCYVYKKTKIEKRAAQKSQSKSARVLEEKSRLARIYILRMNNAALCSSGSSSLQRSPFFDLHSDARRV